MSERAPVPDETRPDLRLVGTDPPVVVAPVRPVLVPPPPDPARCCLGPACPGCRDEWPAVDWEGLTDAE